jgi:hypothetical protein
VKAKIIFNHTTNRNGEAAVEEEVCRLLGGPVADGAIAKRHLKRRCECFVIVSNSDFHIMSLPVFFFHYLLIC